MSQSPGTAIGYARVSTADQDPALQIDALMLAGCVRIFTDHASGSLRERPELTKALDYLRPGDKLVVWRLDRLGRSLRHLIDTVGLLDDRGIALASVTESIDTSTSSGRLILHIFGSLAEFERELIVERTHAGIRAARARGRLGGRPTVLPAEKKQAAQRMYDSRDYTVAAIARTIGVSRATLYRHLRQGVGDEVIPPESAEPAVALTRTA
jgi:DNA invertase Pin-like site-specific DNA recombinase